MEMVECKASQKSQCPRDLLRTHAETTWEKNQQYFDKFAMLKVEALD
jgi:hypothetical protein